MLPKAIFKFVLVICCIAQCFATHIPEEEEKYLGPSIIQYDFNSEASKLKPGKMEQYLAQDLENNMQTMPEQEPSMPQHKASEEFATVPESSTNVLPKHYKIGVLCVVLVVAVSWAIWEHWHWKQLEEAYDEANLGDAWYEIEAYEQATEHYMKALDIFQKRLGDEHEDLAQLYRNLGSVLYDQGYFEEAMIYWEEAERIYEAVSDNTNPDVYAVYNNLLVAYKGLGDQKKVAFYKEKLQEQG